MPSSTILVRDAEEHDYNQVHFMLHDLFSCLKLSHPLVDRHSLGDDSGLCDAKPKENFHVLVAVSPDGDLTGFCDFYFEQDTNKQKVMFLEDLYVRKEYRSSCVGQHLMQRLANICIDANSSLVKLHVPVWNPAREFYQKCGASWNGVMIHEWLEYELDEDAIKSLAQRKISPVG